VKVVIIGAGPAGCAAAIALATHGIRDVLLVDRASFPRDKTCGSAISPLGVRVLKELDVDRDVRRVAYPIHSLRLTTPGGRRLRVCGGETAVILLRKEFDRLLVDRARALGVTFRDRFTVTGFVRDAGRVIGVRSTDEEVRADCVICADGAHSRFSTDPRPKRTLGTIMGWWENVEFEPGEIEMIFDRALSPLYGWMFPETPSRVNIGLVVDGYRLGASGELGSARGLFDSFLQRYFASRLRAARPVGRWAGHPISYSTVMRHGGRPGVLYAGEAARLTNVATGEGIYQAMRSGIFAADAVAAVARGDMREAHAWRQYVWRCRRTFTPGFLVAHLFRGAVRAGVLDGVAGAFGHPRARRLVTWALGSALTGEMGNGKW
jgi:geranylgeranyl reductase family protein